ncbi:MAG TPA: DUF2892 domain-containing protein [bacterium]|nr:DUF2892 domain-containing protein [bacterium]
MEKNVGSVDRWVRVVLGILFLLIFLASGPVKWWGLVGVVLLATAALNWCPAYWLVGMSTRHKPAA